MIYSIFLSPDVISVFVDVFYDFLVLYLAGKFDEVYNNLLDANPNMVVYKKEDIPAHFHYQHNIRIMPILIEAKEGWTIMQNRTGPFMRMYSDFNILVSNCRFCLHQ